MSKEILTVVDAISNEKGVPRDVIFEAVEAALASASRKRFEGREVSVRVHIDRHTGDYETFRRWEVVEDDEFENPDAEIKESFAERRDPPLKRGDVVEEQIETPPSAASPPRPPSRSSCRRCARPSVPKWCASTPSVKASWWPASSRRPPATA